MKLTSRVIHGIVLSLGIAASLSAGGCMTAERERLVDAKYDRAVALCREEHGLCGYYENNRQLEKAYFNSPWAQAGNYLGLRGGGGGGGNRPTFVIILNK